MIKHRRTHTNQRPYLSKKCGFRSANKCGLVRHIRTHTGEKPFKYEACDYSAAQSSPFVIHIRTHTNESHIVARNVIIVVHINLI